jgi:exportin-1
MIREASRDPLILDNPENVKIIGNIMKTNVAACSSIGTFFYPQLARIYMEMLSMYQGVSAMISETIAKEGNGFSLF